MVLKKIPLGVGLPIAEGVKFINNAIEAAERSENKSDDAVKTSNEAKDIAVTSDEKSDSTQAQLDQVVIDGDSSVEAAQARVDTAGNSHDTLKARLDDEHTQVSSSLAETTKHTAGALNAKTYNAVGNGVADDTAYLQQMFIDAYRNKKSVKIPSGDYLISKPILAIADSNELESSINIEGENLENTVIKCSADFTPHLTEGALSNTAAFIIVNESYLNNDNTFKNGTGSTHSVFLDKFYLLCESNNVDYGILFASTNASSSYKRIRTRGFAKSGMKNLGNYYLNVLEKIRVDNSPKSFDFSSGINTSLKLDSCYSVGATDTAYDISGVYMNMTNSCADGCSGTVFDLVGYRGVVLNPGSESPNAKTTFKFGVHSDVTITNPLTFGNFTDPNFVCVYGGAGSKVIFIGGEPAHDPRPSKEQTPLEGSFIQRDTLSYVQVNGCSIPKTKTNVSYRDKTMYGELNTDYGGVKTRYANDLSYLGFDGSYVNNRYVDYFQDAPQIAGNAIYFGLSTTPTDTALGRDLEYYDSVNVGDILLSQSPKRIGGIGWVNIIDTSKDIPFSGVITAINGDDVILDAEPYLENYNEHFQMPKQGWEVYSSSGGSGSYYTVNISNKTLIIRNKTGNWNIDDKVTLKRIPYMGRNIYSKIPTIESGSSEKRTPSPDVGQHFFDTTIGKPIWYKGSGVWVDSTGSTV